MPVYKESDRVQLKVEGTRGVEVQWPKNKKAVPSFSWKNVHGGHYRAEYSLYENFARFAVFGNLTQQFDQFSEPYDVQAGDFLEIEGIRINVLPSKTRPAADKSSP